MTWLPLGVVLSSALLAHPHPPADAEPTIDRFDARPHDLHYRRTSLGVGGRAFFACCELGGSPVLSLSFEVGLRPVALLAEVSSAPVPLIGYDLVVGDFLRGGLGLSFGNAAYRGSVQAIAGFASLGAEARMTIAPWLGPRGGRHGVDVSAAYSMFYLPFHVTVGYRWTPPRWGRRPAS